MCLHKVCLIVADDSTHVMRQSRADDVSRRQSVVGSWLFRRLNELASAKIGCMTVIMMYVMTTLVQLKASGIEWLSKRL